MTDYTLTPGTGHYNLSPVLFGLTAQDYFKCYLAFEKPTTHFSAVPFFLCCRAIELALKAKHLESKSQKEVKQLHSHNLLKLYSGLDPGQQTLSSEELELLAATNAIYMEKEFEYINVYDPGSAYKRFPDLDELGALARKVTRYDTEQRR